MNWDVFLSIYNLWLNVNKFCEQVTGFVQDGKNYLKFKFSKLWKSANWFGILFKMFQVAHETSVLIFCFAEIPFMQFL